MISFASKILISRGLAPLATSALNWATSSNGRKESSS
ncbi:Uncharacterised protein [Vibrio cholerae]|nr:Uncharacterised protein [Vibrio cholerae]